MKQKSIREILSVLLAVELMVGMLPVTSVTASADYDIDTFSVTSDLNLNVSPDSVQAKKTGAFFEKWFKNKIIGLSFAGNGIFAKETKIAVNLPATMDPSKIHIYRYDSANNTYSKLDNHRAYLDKNNYLHYYTRVHGNIVVSEGALVRE